MLPAVLVFASCPDGAVCRAVAGARGAGELHHGHRGGPESRRDPGPATKTCNTHQTPDFDKAGAAREGGEMVPGFLHWLDGVYHGLRLIFQTITF